MTPAPAALVLTGASGVGKSTLVDLLEATTHPGIRYIRCDTHYADLPDSVRSDGHAAQDAVLADHGITTRQVVLVDCEQRERDERLRVDTTDESPHAAADRLRLAIDELLERHARSTPV